MKKKLCKSKIEKKNVVRNRNHGKIHSNNFFLNYWQIKQMHTQGGRGLQNRQINLTNTWTCMENTDFFQTNVENYKLDQD